MQSGLSEAWKQSLAAEERGAYAELFRVADAERKGILLKDEAMAFFKKADIPSNILNEIWDVADQDKRGFLTDQEFSVALKLIACAQHGIMPASPVLKTAVPLPQFENVHFRPTTPARATTPSSPSLSTTGSAAGGDTITPEERSKYIAVFQSAGPADGILTGEKAKTVFLRSNLAPSMLHQIWTLADTRKSGTLNQTEFIIAMHYINRVISGHPLPPSLPASIYAAAASERAMSPNLSKLSASPTLRRHATGNPSAFSNARLPMANRSEISISRDEFTKYKSFFEKLDTNQTGVISGSDAVHFFGHSKLPSSDLARIWDLADTKQAGHLDLQQFAVAMHLIDKRLAGEQIPNMLTNVNIDTGVSPQVTGVQQPPNEMDLLGLGDSSGVAQQQQQQQPITQQPTGQPIMQQATGQMPFPAMLTGPQRTELENNLANIRAETRAQIQHNDQLRSQLEAEQRAVKELQETIQREKETLEALKRAALDAERELEQEKKKKEELVRELQTYNQESKHFKQRAENAQKETRQVKEETASMATQSPKADNANLFALSSAPSTDLFASVPRPDSALSSSSSAAASVQSPSKKTYDPFAGIKGDKASSAASSPVMTLNRLQEEKQARSTTPNVDISDIEAKFPDLSTVEQNFSSPTTAEFPSSATTNEHPPASSNPPAPAAESTRLGMNSPSLARSPMFGSEQQQQGKQQQQQSQPTSAFQQQQLQQAAKPALSPSQAKSVAKYGFDLSAFEDNEESPAPAAQLGSGSGSVKDELSSLFGSPAPPKQETPSNSNFDDIFNVSSSSQNANKEKKPTFDDMFFS